MSDYLTTKELAELLRVKERKVYDLAASGDLPCTKATGKLLFSRPAIEAWLASHSVAGALGAAAAAQPRPAVLLGSHDPLLDWALRESRCGLASMFDSSLDGLARFAARAGVAAGLHLFDPRAAPERAWNIDAVEEVGAGSALISWARRRRGLIFSERLAQTLGRAPALTDLVAAAPALRLAARQPEAGAQRLLDHLLSELSPEPPAETSSDHDGDAPPLVVRSETDAALAVLDGRADVCFGLEAVAAHSRLAFAPIVEERFDLLVDRCAWFDAPLQALFAFARSAAFADHAAATPGYDVADLGAVRWNAR